MIAAVVVVEVRDDDVLDAVRRDTERCQSFTHRPDDLPAALFGHRVVEAGIDDKRAGRPDDRPDEVGERLDDVVRVAKQVVLGGVTVVMCVAERVDFVDVVGHQRWIQRPQASGLRPQGCVSG